MERSPVPRCGTSLEAEPAEARAQLAAERVPVQVEPAEARAQPAAERAPVQAEAAAERALVQVEA